MNIDPRLYCYFGAKRTDEIYELVKNFSKDISIRCPEHKRVNIKGFKILLEIDSKEEVVVTENFKKGPENWIEIDLNPEK